MKALKKILNGKTVCILILALLLLCVSSCTPDAPEENTPQETQAGTTVETASPAPTESSPADTGAPVETDTPTGETSSADAPPETVDPDSLAEPSPDDGFIHTGEEGWGDLVPIGD